MIIQFIVLAKIRCAWSYSYTASYSFCVQVDQAAVDELEVGHNKPITRIITAEAGPDATKNLKHYVPVTGTDLNNFKFLVAGYLPGSTRRIL